MIHAFEDFELNAATRELRRAGESVALEPQVFALIAYLVQERARVVTKDEIVAEIWGGRIVSDAAIASRIKSARQALGDDGAAQRLIRTVHGIGFRFVGEVRGPAPARVIAPAEPPAPAPAPEPAKPSIAVLPFRVVGAPHERAAIAEALPDDLITELSRLRWLFVIARASSFRFRGEDADIARVRAALGVRYCLCGAVEFVGKTMTVSVELSDARDKGVIWGDRFSAVIDAVHEIREEIVRAVISALELQIPLHEAQMAQWKSPNDLDAWAAYHLGLRHMYRFTNEDNQRATALFERAAKLDPTFARAYAGLSFTHFQDAFLHYEEDRDKAVRLTQHFAELSLEHDPLDPFGNFVMGRSHWLEGDVDGGVPWLDRANRLNPNYAQAKYVSGALQALLCRGDKSETDVEQAVSLSPLDPLLYAMLTTRALSYIVRGDAARGAAWAERGARSPGAHGIIEMIAVAAHGLNGDDARAKAWAASVRARAPRLTRADFERVFTFRDEAVRAELSAQLARQGF